MQEVFILLGLALVWIIFATIQDIKKREVANWLNFSLIIFALGFRFFYSLLYFENFNFFYQGLIGLAVFTILGNLLYYGRMFAGGDAKLMIALGTILPFSTILSENLKIFALFFIIFLFTGAIYGLSITTYLGVKNHKEFKNEFIKQIKKNKRLTIYGIIFGIIFASLKIFENIFFIFGILILLLPFLYSSAKAVDETCMKKKVNPKELTEGDWLYEKIRIGQKVIEPKWEGLNKNEIKLLQRENKKVEIRQGIAFVPVFLISIILLAGIYFSKIKNLLWFIGFN